MVVNKNSSDMKKARRVGRPLKLPKMKVYHPRNRSSNPLALTRQQIIDLEHRLSADIGAFLVLLEEGTAQQISQAALRAKSDFLKLNGEIKKLSEAIGGNLPSLVSHFISTIDKILHTNTNYMDQALKTECYKATQRLESALKNSKENL